ncbi:MAG: hypothetical protein AAB018_06180 [Actinomycetota bacterium]
MSDVFVMMCRLRLTTKLSDPAHEGARLQPGRDGRVRCSAWLGVAPRLRHANDCALKLSDVLLMAEDSGQPATQLKPPERVTRSALAAMLGMKTCGVMVGCDSVPPNDQGELPAGKKPEAAIKPKL